MILRSNSHRSTAKLLRLFPDAQAKYLRSTFQAGFYEISDEAGEIRITGVSKPREQDTSKYADCWKASSRD